MSINTTSQQNSDSLNQSHLQSQLQLQLQSQIQSQIQSQLQSQPQSQPSIQNFPLTKFLTSKPITKNEHYILARLNHSEFYYLLEVLCNQQNLVHYFQQNTTISSKYSLYKIPLLSSSIPKAEKIMDLCDCQFPISFQHDKNLLFLHCYNPQQLTKIIQTYHQNNRRYLFIPISASNTDGGDGHMMSIVFDIKLHHIYLFDPNGHTDYFDCCDNYGTIIHNHNKVELLLQKYTEELNVFLKKENQFKFQNYLAWNPFDQILNHSIQQKVNGNCVVCTILMTHLLHVTSSNPKSCLEKEYHNLVHRNKYELHELILSYSNTIYELIGGD